MHLRPRPTVLCVLSLCVVACGDAAPGDEVGSTGDSIGDTSDLDTSSSSDSGSSDSSSTDSSSDTDGCDCPDDGDPCTEDLCDQDNLCTHPLAPAGTVCRPSSGSCDLEEVCDGASPSCPADLWDSSCTCPENGPIAGYAEHDGLRAIDGSNFALVDTQAWAANQAIIDELGLAKVGLDELDLNRTGTPPTGALQSFLSGMVDYQGGFEWQSGDQSVSYWIPQGLSGGTSPNHDWVIVSWHYDETHIADDANPPASGDKGVRLSFAAVDDLGGDVPYRHVLLAQPDAQAGLASIDIHAGGLAFYPPYLYVA
ncbi:MAG: hypothetical protein KC431_24095, partial [Myxococcales bacterium]|nr:hypothetical protein [Myxococcales bacterium]